METYNICDIEDKIGLDREKMVALALLVGCDYVPKGVPGVGIEKASKLLINYKGVSPLQRLVFQVLKKNSCNTYITLKNL